MKNRATVFVTDRGYLVPTLVAARQVARNPAARYTDVLVYLIDIAPDMVENLRTAFADDGIQFFNFDAALINLPDGCLFRAGHVPLAALGRLVLAPLIPEQYEHIVYLDGDTQIAGDITPLVTYDVPAGRIAAVNGSRWLKKDAHGRLDPWSAQYLAEIGGVDPEDYFNSGLLAFRRETWVDIGPKAFAYFLANGKACYHHDQSALNAVCKGRRIELPPAYNFHTEYAELLVQSSYQPRIVHFTGQLKPWTYVIAPWGERYAKPYRDMLAEMPFLRPYLPRLDRASGLRRAYRLARKIVQTLPHAHKIWQRRASFMAHVRTHRFPI